MKKKITLAGIFAAGLLAACAADPAGGPVARQQAAAAQYQPAGEAVTCVNINQIRQTHVRDDRTIDFEMSNGNMMRNTLPHSCPSLGFERAFAYETSLSQLCNVDTITVIQQGGGPRRGATCGLGTFQPVQKVDDGAN